jgi:hypothetical protein
MRRPSISRREPVIALRRFRFKGRDYKEGSPLDRRRCRMPHSKLIKMIRDGACVLAKDMNPEKLAEYGFIYNTKNPRLKLTKLSREKNTLQKNDNEMKKHFPEEKEEVTEGEVIEEETPEKIDVSAIYPKEGDAKSSEPTLKHIGGGWYDVMVDSKQVNNAGLRKNDALKFIDDYTIEGVNNGSIS